MSTSINILPQLGTVFVRFAGSITVKEAASAFNKFAQDPRSKSIHKHLIHFSRVTDFENKFVELMGFNARMAEELALGDTQYLLVFYTPTPVSQKIANLSANSWPPETGVIVRSVDTESAALSILGLPQNSFEELLEGETQG